MLKTLAYINNRPQIVVVNDVTPRDVMLSDCPVLVNAKTSAWLAQNDSSLCFYGRAHGLRIGQRPFGGEAA